MKMKIVVGIWTEERGRGGVEDGDKDGDEEEEEEDENGDEEEAEDISGKYSVLLTLFREKTLLT